MGGDHDGSFVGRLCFCVDGSDSEDTMRILFINSIQMFGGGEVWLLTMMRALTERGHRVHLLCRPKVPLETRARAEGYDVHTLRIRGDFDPVAVFKTWRLLRRLRVDVVCTNMDRELRFGGLAAGLAGVSGVVPRRGSDYPLKDTWVYRWTYNHLASGIIANSRATKRSLLRNAPWLQPERIQVIYNGVDPSRFLSPSRTGFRDALGIPDGAFLVGFVGQLDERKGVETLVRGFRTFSADFPDARLILVGTGQEEMRLRKLSETLRDRVIFAGYREDVDEVMKAIDVLVLPSLWEGFGIVLIEAMAAGKPVLTTLVSNMPEIVTDGQDGFLIPPRDADALAKALVRLAGNPKFRKRMGRNGQRTVRERFTLDRMVDETEALFLRVARQ